MASDSQFVNGAAKLSRRIATIRERLGVPALTKEIGELLLTRTQRRFDEEVDPDGNPWVPLSLHTILIKRRLGYGDKKKLVRTQRLRNSIRLLRGSASGAVFTNTGAGVRIGIPAGTKEAAYGRVQNYGGGRIPARRFLGIGALDIKSVDSFMRRRAQQIVDQS